MILFAFAYLSIGAIVAKLLFANIKAAGELQGYHPCYSVALIVALWPVVVALILTEIFCAEN